MKIAIAVAVLTLCFGGIALSPKPVAAQGCACHEVCEWHVSVDGVQYETCHTVCDNPTCK